MKKRIFILPVSKLLVLTLLASTLTLSACGHDPLGMKKKKAPDEFAVMPVKPLTMPSQYTLTAPQDLKKKVEKTPQQIAKNSLYKDADQDQNTPENIEDDPFVRKLVAQGVTGDIRDQIEDDRTYKGEKQYLFDSLAFWKKKKIPGVVVDAEKERERLQKNTKEGLPITEGETPKID